MKSFVLALLVLLAPAAALADKMPEGIARALVHDLEELLAPPDQWKGGGNKVVLQGVELGTFDEKHLNARIRLRYHKAKGFPQYSTSGLANARFTIFPGTNGEYCLSEVKVDKVELNRTPTWLDGAWIAKQLDDRLPNEVCTK